MRLRRGNSCDMRQPIAEVNRSCRGGTPAGDPRLPLRSGARPSDYMFVRRRVSRLTNSGSTSRPEAACVSDRRGLAESRAHAGLSDRSVLQPLRQVNLHGIARFFPDHLTEVSFDRQLVGAVAHGHERTPEGVAVYRAADLDEPPGPEKLNRIGHYHIGPPALIGTSLQGSDELLVQPDRMFPLRENSRKGIRPDASQNCPVEGLSSTRQWGVIDRPCQEGIVKTRGRGIR